MYQTFPKMYEVICNFTEYFPRKQLQIPSTAEGYLMQKMCIVPLQLNDPLQKIIILKKQMNTPLCAEKQKQKNIYPQREAHGFISISSSAQPGYLMLGWRVGNHFIFVSVHIPEEYFSIPKHCKGQGSRSP